MSALAALLEREWRLAARSKSDWLMPPFFLVVVITLFGLGTEPNDARLIGFAPAIIWVASLLAALLTLERLFRADHEDGTLEQLCMAPFPLYLAVLAKLLSHWLLTGLPLALLSVPLAMGLGLPGNAVPALLLGLLLGTPCISAIGGFVAALTVGLPRAGLLLPVLVLPMIAPVVIFGAGAVRSALDGLDVAAPLYFLAAILSLCITLIPWVASAALRNAIE
ncbi:heme exporter protein CcmB [Sinimarinibacterium sp. NLF-5-8]|uniref:heme exporter protein CcmB n=1 Tax=Sinimarinibacterium sp. NLF-5-8 TaxID=2698684 RepID=UPI00137BAF73|nr:heme exporter protein CcmB [Sinimarinibacterium sp. NLF-5-8]QHS08683.1 heme exporter protein CcmB [Sinimarinibacterium sp. NLF-5-8]